MRAKYNRRTHDGRDAGCRGNYDGHINVRSTGARECCFVYLRTASAKKTSSKAKFRRVPMSRGLSALHVRVKNTGLMEKME
jgi:hypothetical protein